MNYIADIFIALLICVICGVCPVLGFILILIAGALGFYSCL